MCADSSGNLKRDGISKQAVLLNNYFTDLQYCSKVGSEEGSHETKMMSLKTKGCT